ncbi:hypothetical protein NC653_031304 [Populus alba x Populus x berolinensis]|uniref:Uncharacterized protein n=1 Tax=Populus alba x Populus x berolinensis TaxID=444605 RepID=A0AAD6Q180_9ROSI|nr:hypothetical protein NC653_031304 [Populus alba x Populus x berolinensis]
MTYPNLVMANLLTYNISNNGKKLNGSKTSKTISAPFLDYLALLLTYNSSNNGRKVNRSKTTLKNPTSNQIKSKAMTRNNLGKIMARRTMTVIYIKPISRNKFSRIKYTER